MDPKKKEAAVNFLLNRGEAEERFKKVANTKAGDPLKELIISEFKDQIGQEQAEKSAKKIVKVYLQRMGF